MFLFGLAETLIEFVFGAHRADPVDEVEGAHRRDAGADKACDKGIFRDGLDQFDIEAKKLLALRIGDRGFELNDIEAFDGRVGGLGDGRGLSRTVRGRN